MSRAVLSQAGACKDRDEIGASRPFPSFYFGTATVIDGDTFRFVERSYESSLNSTQTFKARLAFIDAPELKQTCTYGPSPFLRHRRTSNKPISYSCGKKAAKYLAKLVRGKRLRCYMHGRDKYYRWLFSCSIVGTNIDIGQEMVRVGWALVLPRHKRYYYGAAYSARKRKVGMLKGRYVSPWIWRRQQRKRR